MKLLLLIASLVLSQQTFAAEKNSESRITPSICQEYSSVRSVAQGYGSDNENCLRASVNAESGALHQCYASGHSNCEVFHSGIIQMSYNRCEVEATAAARFNSMCEPRKTFVRSAWAKNYGSEHANCSQAQRVANDVAIKDCLRAGFRKCDVISQHVLRTEGYTLCETSSVVKAQF